MEIQNPDSVSTDSRSEMVCPSCFTVGLEQHPGYVSDYSGKSEVLYATRCPNLECEYHRGKGVPSKLVQRQYSGTSLSSLISIQSLLTVVVVFVGIGFVSVNIFGFALPATGVGIVDDFFDGGTQSVSGSIGSPTGSVSGVEVSVQGTDISTQSDSNGYFSLNGISTASDQRLVIIPPSGSPYAPTSVMSSELPKSSDPDIELNAEIVLSSVEELLVSDVVTNDSIEYSVAHPDNLPESVTIVVRPPETSEVADSTILRGSGTHGVLVPGEIVSDSVRVSGFAEMSLRTAQYTWSGDSIGLGIPDGTVPASISVNLTEELPPVEKSESFLVSNGDNIEVPYSPSTVADDVQLTLSGGSSTAPTTVEGVFSTDNPRIKIRDVDAPSEVTVTITGNKSNQERTALGNINDESITLPVSGSVPLDDVVFRLDDVTPTEEVITKSTVSADGSSGLERKRTSKKTIDDSGTYTVSFSESIDRNGGLVTKGYQINGESTAVSGDTATLSLSEDDTIWFWIEASQQTYSQDTSFDGFQDVTVKNSRVSDSEVAKAESVSITADLSYAGSGGTSIPVYLFVDGVREQKKSSVFIDSRQETQVQFTGVSFTRPGVHTVSINDGEQIDIVVGSGKPKSGAGSVTAELTRSPVNPGIELQDRRTQETVCAVTVQNPTCEIASVNPDDPQFMLDATGVQSGKYEVLYTERNGQGDVTIDIDADGEPELTHPGVLEDNETLQATKSLPAGTRSILFDIGIGDDLPYVITYTQKNQILQPKIIAGTEVVVNETSSFKGSKTYTFTPPTQTTQYRVETSDLNEFTAEFRWVESGQSTYPSVLINRIEVCSPIDFIKTSQCKVTADSLAALQTDDLELVMLTNSQAKFETEIQAVRLPSAIDVSGPEGATRITPSIETGSQRWSGDSAEDILVSRDNTVTIVSPGETESELLKTTFEYTYVPYPAENPTVVLITEGIEKEYEFPNDVKTSGGNLDDSYTIEIPSDYFSFGTNKIYIQSENGGAVVVDIESKGVTEDQIIIRR